MGIMAESQLREQDGVTYFTVVPKDKTESLEKIRHALDLFLAAPGAKDFERAVIGSREPAVGQWATNVYHLKGQLALAISTIQSNQATIQAQQAAIENLQLSNFQYRKLVAEQNEKKPASEDIIAGVLEVKKWEMKAGFVVNWPEIFRKLERAFK